MSNYFQLANPNKILNEGKNRRKVKISFLKRKKKDFEENFDFMQLKYDSMNNCCFLAFLPTIL